jgi:hypothetical protein
MPLVEQLFQLLDPTRQFRAPLPVKQPSHLPELLLRVPDVQGQDRPGEQLTELLFQALLAIDHDLHHLVGLRREATSRGLFPCPVHRRVSRAEGPVHLLVAGAVQPAILAPAEGVHHYQGGAATVLALISLLAPHFAATPPPPRPAPMPLTAAVAAAAMT